MAFYNTVCFENSAIGEGLYEKQKAVAGGFATVVWLGAGLFLFITTDNATFLSWQAAAYFFVGPFISALLIGVAYYATERGIAKILVSLFREVGPTKVIALTTQTLGFLLMIVFGVITYRAADFVISDILFPSPATSNSGAIASVQCKQPLPEFTLGTNSNPSQKEIEDLCDCIWSAFPENGWERRISAIIKSGGDPGWRGKGFVSRFGMAVDTCGGHKL
ncbi:MAG: hypothetical protein OXN23_08865 [Gammaproteobacteria bacterium]|nr:hypothetical protein [Gammaproteobacteria bacterium]MDE0301898.1 hypothetical protein [Gammaproteobacteria bacterium]